ncbi:hypothetical protein [Parasphingorhabdus sp.]|uniref:hypothetical protein n=1 Tax=Parasphingorhabdus sp. TaxID=2709688 RepID=UPI003263DF5C
MSDKKTQLLAGIMPGMLKHEGKWEGVYRHIDTENREVDRHQALVECIFPAEGPFAYIQKNIFTWDDGREYRSTLNGVLREGKLWWDNENFNGCGWETDFGLVLLNLDRKDDPDANFYEIICLGDDGNHRSRTWHWFKHGKLFKRTLCDEHRVAPIMKDDD